MGHGVFQSLVTLVAACTKHISKASRKLFNTPSGKSSDGVKFKSNGADHCYLDEYYEDDHNPAKLPPPSPRPLKTPPRSPLHQTLSRKASLIPFLGNKKKKEAEEEEDDQFYDDCWDDDSELDEDGTPRHGDDGVWRKNILMGEKCEPLDFSGVIYYDNNGRRLNSEVPNGKKNNANADGGQHVPSNHVGEHQLGANKLPPPPQMKSLGDTLRTTPPRSPLHQIFSRKTSLVPFLGEKDKKKKNEKKEDGGSWEEEVSDREEEVNEGGVWRKNILMGEKCEPLDFSGVIYYDNDGRRLDQIPPRSPRHPMAGGSSPFPSFSFPVVIDKA